MDMIQAGPPVADASAPWATERVRLGFPRIHAFLSQAMYPHQLKSYLRWMAKNYRLRLLGEGRQSATPTVAYLGCTEETAKALLGLTTLILGDSGVPLLPAVPWDKVRDIGILDDRGLLYRVRPTPPELNSGFALEAHGFGRYLFDLYEPGGLFFLRYKREKLP